MTSRPSLLVSLNEVESLAAKAVRGGGAGWGVAEDVARGVRWMARHALDWSEPLLRLLDGADGASTLRPTLRVADLLAGARPGERWRLSAGEPVWALALLSGALYGGAATLDVAWDRGAARLHPDGGVSLDGPPAGLEALGPCALTVALADPAPALRHRLPATARRSTVSAEAWHALEGYAARTYVPASVQSRRTGAGGGRVDGD